MILLIRPRRIEGESWEGYLLRLSEMNGLDGVKSLSKRLGLTVEKLMMSLPTEVLPRLGVSQGNPVLASQPTIWARRRLYNTGRSIYSRVCPMCLSQNQVPCITSLWDVGLNLVCKIHERCLLDTCPSCLNPIDYLRPSIFRCRCGQDFRLIDMPTIPAHLHVIERIFAIEKIRTTTSETSVQKGRSVFPAVFALRRLISLSECDKCLIAHQRLGYSYSQIFRLDDLERVSEWFKDWPHGFVSGIRSARASYSSAGRLFVPTLILAVKNFPLIREVLEFEWEELRQWSDENIRKVMPANFNQFRASNIFSLSKAVGMEPHALFCLAFAKVVPIYMGSSDPRRAIVLPDYVSNLSSRLRGMASHNAAAPDSALSISQVIRRLSRLGSKEIQKFVDDLGKSTLPLVCREENPIRLDDVLVNLNDLQNWRTLQAPRLEI